MFASSSYLDILQSLLEGEGHTAADDKHVDLVKHVFNELDLIRDLGTVKDRKRTYE